jgi:post-segregation antitoxin (ccd killing protein)
VPPDETRIFQSRDLDTKEEAPTENIVAAVLPLIAAEVQAAKAEAWDEGAAHAEGRGGYYDPEDNPHRATETGDRA